MTTKDLLDTAVVTEIKCAALEQKRMATQAKLDEAKAALDGGSASGDELDALVEQQARAERLLPAIAAQYRTAQNELQVARSAFAAARAPENQRETATLLRSVEESFRKALPPFLEDAQAIVTLADELDALGVEGKRPAPELSTVHGALAFAFNTALTGAGDGLTPVVVTRGFNFTSAAPAGVVNGRAYQIHERIRLPGSTAARLEREGHVARADLN